MHQPVYQTMLSDLGCPKKIKLTFLVQIPHPPGTKLMMAKWLVFAQGPGWEMLKFQIDWGINLQFYCFKLGLEL